MGGEVTNILRRICIFSPSFAPFFTDFSRFIPLCAKMLGMVWGRPKALKYKKRMPESKDFQAFI